MRFRKSIQICKGVKVNFSKSGISTTVGGRGCSVNIGKKGTYLNTGIPGTGLYDRTRLAGGTKNTRTSASSTASYTSPYSITNSVSYHYDDNGKFTFYDDNKQEITDSSILRQIKAMDEFKQLQEQLNNERIQEYEEEINKFINIKDIATKVYTIGHYQYILNHKKPETYVRKKFYELKPRMDYVVAKLREEAECNVKTLKFWQKNSLIEQYVEDRKDAQYNQLLSEWESKKACYEKAQDAIELTNNKKFAEEHSRFIEDLTLRLNNDEKTVDTKINEWLSSIEFPFEFNLQYNIIGSILYVDLDLPEIEDMKTTKAQKMANGSVKIKNKTQKEIKEDYTQCVFGLAVFFTTYLFSIAIGVNTIMISGYTQRRNNKGDINDDYIYSIKFTRQELSEINLKSKSSEEICMSFENRCILTASKIFKTIEPYS